MKPLVIFLNVLKRHKITWNPWNALKPPEITRGVPKPHRTGLRPAETLLKHHWKPLKTPLKPPSTTLNGQKSQKRLWNSIKPPGTSLKNHRKKTSKCVLDNQCNVLELKHPKFPLKTPQTPRKDPWNPIKLLPESPLKLSETCLIYPEPCLNVVNRPLFPLKIFLVIFCISFYWWN